MLARACARTCVCVDTADFKTWHSPGSLDLLRYRYPETIIPQYLVLAIQTASRHVTNGRAPSAHSRQRRGLNEVALTQEVKLGVHGLACGEHGRGMSAHALIPETLNLTLSEKTNPKVEYLR